MLRIEGINRSEFLLYFLSIEKYKGNICINAVRRGLSRDTLTSSFAYVCSKKVKKREMSGKAELKNKLSATAPCKL